MNELMHFDFKRAANLLRECRERKRRRDWMAQPEVRERYRPYHAGYTKNKRKQDPQFKIKESFHRKLRAALAGEWNSPKLLEWTGATVDEIRAHFQAWFEPGMDWSNRGGRNGWQVDCVIPCENFDLRNTAQLRQCFSLSNLRPRWRHHNQTKDRALR